MRVWFGMHRVVLQALAPHRLGPHAAHAHDGRPAQAVMGEMRNEAKDVVSTPVSRERIVLRNPRRIVHSKNAPEGERRVPGRNQDKRACAL